MRGSKRKEEVGWTMAADVLEGNLGPWIPFGRRCLVRGKINQQRPILVNIGAGIYLEMTKEEAQIKVGERSGRTLRGLGSVKEGEDGAFDIREDFTADDLELLTARDCPRVAHQFSQNQASSTHDPLYEQQLEPAEMEEELPTTKPIMPLRERIVERSPILEKPRDPASRVLEGELRMSFFRRMKQLERTSDSEEDDTEGEGGNDTVPRNM